MRVIPASFQENLRQEPRFPGLRKAVVHFGKKHGTVIDVSKSGLAVHFDEKYIFPGYKNQIDIEWAVNGLFLGALPVRAIPYYHTVEEPLKLGMSTRCGLEFDVLREQQRFKLDYFIWLCTNQRA